LIPQYCSIDTSVSIPLSIAVSQYFVFLYLIVI
jgi:hypothetical protein